MKKVDNFKPGDLCVYCEIDSLTPERREFEFLAPRKYRIKTTKLLGEISQGIAFPLFVLENVGELERFAKTVKKDNVKFSHITYQEILVKLSNDFYNDNEEYLNYLTDRYL